MQIHTEPPVFLIGGTQKEHQVCYAESFSKMIPHKLELEDNRAPIDEVCCERDLLDHM